MNEECEYCGATSGHTEKCPYTLIAEKDRLTAEVERLRAFADAFGQSGMYYAECGCHVCEKYRAALTQEPRT